jgi:hypothetical protein
MPSMISFMRPASSPKRAAKGSSAFVTGCCGWPAKRLATSVRHHASFVRAIPVSSTSSAMSSTSRQNA